MQHTDHIEPAVLTLFRVFTSAMWLLLSVQWLILPAHKALDPFAALMWWSTALLSLYLWIAPLQSILGRWYLPLALSVATITPIIGDALSISSRPIDTLVADPARLYFWLIPPLLFTSTHYGLRTIAMLIGVSTIVPLFLQLPDATSTLTMRAILYHAIARFLLFTLIGITVARLSAAQRAQQRELAQKNSQLAAYAARQEELLVNRERTRIARELHDTLAHTLSAISIQLAALDVQIGPDALPAQHTLQQTQELTRRGLQEARRALQTLRASPLEKLGLSAALQELATRNAAQHGLQLELDLVPSNLALTPEVEQQLFRIAEEAIQNTVRHANASMLSLRLSSEANMAVLVIGDTGQGFELQRAARTGHFGLQGMRERAACIHGSMEIRSTPGVGTTVCVHAPLCEASA